MKKNKLEVLGTPRTIFLRYHFGIFNEKLPYSFYLCTDTCSERESIKKWFQNEILDFSILVDERGFGKKVFIHMVIEMVEAEIWDKVYF